MANRAERTFLKGGTEECSPHSFDVRRSAFRDYYLVFAVIFCTIFGGGCSSWESFRERSANLKHELMDNGWDDPEAVNRMARGEELFTNASYAAALKEFKKVADNQSNHAEMSERARFLQAECRRLLGEWPEAVDTYHKLLIDFPTGHHRQEACARMYEIADFWLDDFRKELERRSGEKGILHWQPSWPNPLDKQRPAIDQEGRALEAMENIHIHDPLGPLADKALFWCGYVNFIRGNFQKSDEFFSELVDKYRESPLRPAAISYAITAKNNATGGAVYDGRKCAEALQLVRTAEATVPELTSSPEMADKLTRAKFAIRSQQAEKDFRTAEYYERTGHPGSAVFYYELVRRRFPGTALRGLRGRAKRTTARHAAPGPSVRRQRPDRAGEREMEGNGRQETADEHRPHRRTVRSERHDHPGGRNPAGRRSSRRRHSRRRHHARRRDAGRCRRRLSRRREPHASTGVWRNRARVDADRVSGWNDSRQHTAGECVSRSNADGRRRHAAQSALTQHAAGRRGARCRSTRSCGSRLRAYKSVGARCDAAKHRRTGGRDGDGNLARGQLGALRFRRCLLAGWSRVVWRQRTGDGVARELDATEAVSFAMRPWG